MFCRLERRVEPDEWIAERSESDKMRKAQASITYALIANNKMYLFNHWSHYSSVTPPEVSFLKADLFADTWGGCDGMSKQKPMQPGVWKKAEVNPRSCGALNASLQGRFFIPFLAGQQYVPQLSNDFT
jgi:hypothetical protein